MANTKYLKNIIKEHQGDANYKIKDNNGHHSDEISENQQLLSEIRNQNLKMAETLYFTDENFLPKWKLSKKTCQEIADIIYNDADKYISENNIQPHEFLPEYYQEHANIAYLNVLKRI